MESSKLKNIVLLILVVTNLFLLLLTVSQRLESRQRRQQALEDALTLLEDKGITVDRSGLSQRDFPPSLTLERDREAERVLFTQLLGEGTALTQRGQVTYYLGNLGQAEVRSDGAFSVSLLPGAYPMEEAGKEDAAREILARIGFSGVLAGQGEGSLTFLETCEGTPGEAVPVYSCSATLTFSQGSLLSISGHRLVGVPQKDAQDSGSLSLAALLVRFRAGLVESGSACTAISRAEPGYALRSDDAGQLRLLPVLRLETDTGAYLLDAATGELSRL